MSYVGFFHTPLFIFFFFLYTPIPIFIFLFLFSLFFKKGVTSVTNNKKEG